MSKHEILSEFLSLSPQGQRAVVDLIKNLKQKAVAIAASAGENGDIAVEPFVGMWKDREDLAESSVWVRTIRGGDW